jgi:hypothetical protein
VAVFLGGIAVLCAVVGALAARAALASSPPAGRVRGPRPDAALVLGVSLVAALLPGLVQSLFVERVASAAGSVQGALDVATARVPGAAWPGGYLTVAVLVALATAGSATTVVGRRWPARELGVPATAARSLRSGLARLPARVRLARSLSRVSRGLAAADGWLVEQPGLALVVVGVVVCLFIFR